LAGPADIWTCAGRERGYRAALEKAGLEFRPGDVVHTGLSVEDGETAMVRILDGAPLHADAVFCVNDPVAVGAFKTLRKCGLRVPSDLGLVGFSGTLESEIMETPLTTVRQEARLIGQRAAQILLSRMTGETPSGKPPVLEVVPTTLLVRESSLRKTQ
jgi:DNA-binding LacI/PurR family transcriptional regulator